jgi:hypothetical protein
MTIRHDTREYDYDVVFTVDMTKATHESIEEMQHTGEFSFETVLEVEKNGFMACQKYGASKKHDEIYTDISSMLFEWQNLLFNNDLLMKKIKVTITVEEVK